VSFCDLLGQVAAQQQTAWLLLQLINSYMESRQENAAIATAPAASKHLLNCSLWDASQNDSGCGNLIMSADLSSGFAKIGCSILILY